MLSTSAFGIFLPSSLIAFLTTIGFTLPDFLTASNALLYFVKNGISAALIFVLSTGFWSSVCNSAASGSSWTSVGAVLGAGKPFLFKKLSAFLIFCCVCWPSKAWSLFNFLFLSPPITLPVDETVPPIRAAAAATSLYSSNASLFVRLLPAW